jgi:hypothetical protein
MRYLKLFEAFKSDILSSILKYIKIDDRKKFLMHLKDIFKIVDFPISEIKDEYFKYLPFSAALKEYKRPSIDVTCRAKSVDIFKDNGVEGEVCNSGRIKRKWGKHYREVDCPLCDGTGAIKKQYKIELMKFWFTADGEYITTSVVDGSVLNSIGLTPVRSIKELTSGDSVVAQIEGREINGTFISDERGIYIIHNSPHAQGGSPRLPGWSKYGKYSWNIGHVNAAEYYRIKKMASKVDTTTQIDNTNPYNYNFEITVRHNSYTVKTEYNTLEANLKNAHFCLILDYNKLLQSSLKVSDIKAKRKEYKEGSLLDPMQKNEEILKKNLLKYLNKISDNLEISEDVKNIKNSILRILGHKMILYVLLDREVSILEGLNKISQGYYNLIYTSDIDSKKHYINNLKNTIKNLSLYTTKASAEIKNALERAKSKVGESSDEMRLIELSDEISNTIYEKVKSLEIETVDDIRVIYYKLISFLNILNNEQIPLFISRLYRLKTEPMYFIDIVKSRPEYLDRLEKINIFIYKM